MLLNVFEALNTKQSFFPAVYFGFILYHIDEWAGKSSLLEIEFGLCPKTIIHFHVTTARTACPPLVLTPLKVPEEKCGEKFFNAKQKSWSFLLFNFIKQKKKIQQLFRLNLSISFIPVSKKANPQHLSINVYLYEGRIETLLYKSLQERVCSLLNVPGCSSTAAEAVPLPLPHSRWSARGLCAQTEVLRNPVSICATLSPPVPAHVLLKLLGSPPDLASPAGHAHRHGHWCGALLQVHFLFSLFIRLIQHSHKRWRLQIPLSAAGTSHSRHCHHWGSRKGRPRIKFWVFPLAARISSTSLTHYTQTVPVFCLLPGSVRGTYFSFSPIPCYQPNGKSIPDPCSNTDFHVTLTRSLYPSCSPGVLLQ